MAYRGRATRRLRTAGTLGKPDGRFAVLKQRFMSPMHGFRPYFLFVTCAVTHPADGSIDVSCTFRADRIQDTLDGSSTWRRSASPGPAGAGPGLGGIAEGPRGPNRTYADLPDSSACHSQVTVRRRPLEACVTAKYSPTSAGNVYRTRGPGPRRQARQCRGVADRLPRRGDEWPANRRRALAGVTPGGISESDGADATAGHGWRDAQSPGPGMNAALPTTHGGLCHIHLG
jgi:hypothetical protein